MTSFTVTLKALRDGATHFTTLDTFEATTADEAERRAIDEWTSIRADLTFEPLVTTEVPASQGRKSHLGAQAPPS